MRSRGRWDGQQTLDGEAHEQLVQDISRLQESRIQLVARLERVVVALALTLDAEAAAEQRLALIQDRAGARRLGMGPRDQWSVLAQRYRDVIRALESINTSDLDGNGSLR